MNERNDIDWFKSYISNRKQFFVIKCMYDLYYKIIRLWCTSRIYLRAIVFIWYKYDTVNTTALLELILFADDTTLLFSQ